MEAPKELLIFLPVSGDENQLTDEKRLRTGIRLDETPLGRPRGHSGQRNPKSLSVRNVFTLYINRQDVGGLILNQGIQVPFTHPLPQAA